MIRPRDALTLATTKLRARKARTIVTATLASIFFVVIVFASAVVYGAIQSHERYSANGLSKRFIAQVHMNTWGESSEVSPELLAELKRRHDAIVAAKVAEAKRLGIEYDPASEPEYVFESESADEPTYYNPDSRAVQEVLAERRAKEPSAHAKVATLSAPYNPIQHIDFMPFGDTANLRMMSGGKENFRPDAEQGGFMGYGGIETLSYMPRFITESFLFDDADLTPAETVRSEIPVIIPLSDAEKALELKPLPNSATNAEKLERLEYVKRKARNHTVQACYRNGASQQLVDEYHFQVADKKKNQAKEGYQPPLIEYALPSESSCGPVTIVTDRRTPEQRSSDERYQQFAERFDARAKPIERKITFRIVGLSPDVPNLETMSTTQGILALLGGSSLQSQWVVPDELVDVELQSRIIPASEDPNTVSFGLASQLVEFSSADDVRQFVNKEGCTWDCDSKPYISYFGSNSVLIDELTEGAASVLKWVLLVVAIMAAILMGGLAGRVITDSRRETAVFRAIGAKRSDIWAVYMLYILLFATIVAGIAMAVGLTAAAIMSAAQQDDLTTMARLIFIESKETYPYTLVGVWPLALLSITGTIIATGLVAILLPLTTSLGRNPLRDMRNE